MKEGCSPTKRRCLGSIQFLFYGKDDESSGEREKETIVKEKKSDRHREKENARVKECVRGLRNSF
ncbi:hypothetical protein WN55_05116 [Dufourea novaeangliae]|uniref:Uncharacterized protein n=1 Tax=Dufourea novaeangliae TaxID=178035 RepID=A0A154PQB7_DUFNO|nr:hypothetical protein WN55_05116 [Dufourea novaeangliae]